MRSATALILLGVLLGAMSFQAHAAEPAPPENADLIRINFPANVELRVLVDFVSQRLGINILYDEQLLNKRITLKTPEQIPQSSLLTLLQSVLQMKDLTLIDDESTGFKRIVPTSNLIQIARPPSDAAIGSDAVTQMFRIQHGSPRQIENLVKPFLTQPGGNMLTVDNDNLLIVTDLKQNLTRVASLIETLDKPRPESVVRFVQVQYLEAEQLASQVKQLIASKRQTELAGAAGGGAGATTVEVTSDKRTNRLIIIGSTKQAEDAAALAASLDVSLDLETKVYEFKVASPDRVDKLTKELIGPLRSERVYRSAVDDEGAMLIVTTTPDIHAEIAKLQGELDKALPDRQMPVRFYKLSNATATKVLQTIRAIEGGTDISAAEVAALIGERNEPGPEFISLPRPEGPGVTPVGQVESSTRTAQRRAADAPEQRGVQTGQAVVTADVNTNSIIVVAPPEVQSVYEHLIQKLDQRRPQVMIEATLVALDTSNGFSFGVEVSTNFDDGRYINFSSFGLSDVDAGTGALTLEPGRGFNSVLVPANEVQVVLRALASSGRAKVLSSPKLLVNDNATGYLTSVNEAPFTSLNASDTVSTTSFAGFVSAGTTITVTPHISEGDHLNLEYTIDLNSFTGEGSDNLPPPRQTNSIQSEVTVPDGHTIILGGLNRKDFSETFDRVPILGDLPILEHFLGSKSKNASETTLFVFLRPVILRDDRFNDLKYLSNRDMGHAEVDGDFPTSKPVLMN